MIICIVLIIIISAGTLLIMSAIDVREARHRRFMKEWDAIINDSTEVTDEIFRQDDTLD